MALLSLLQIVVGICGLVCFIMVVVQMFQQGQTVLGIVCIVLCGIGGVIAFVYGWMKAAEWDIKNVMLAWTGCIVVGVLLSFANIAMQQQ